MASPEVSITIRINDGTNDISISCQIGWSIGRLKEAIRDKHPLNPNIYDQRLFYKEVELLHHQVISSFLKISDELHILKLIIKPKEVSAASVQSNPTAMDSSGLRYRHNAEYAQYPQAFNNSWMLWQQSQMAAAYYQHYPYNHHPNTHENSAALWQQYQQQLNDYMRYYNSHFQSQGIQPTQPSPIVPTEPVNPQAAAPADPPPPPQANPPDANPPMNAQGGFVAAENDDLAPHDWLDVLFTLFRYAFVLSIIYFYSSFWRFLMVAGFFIVMYIYQSGAFRAQRRPPHPDEVGRNENERNGEPENTDDNNNDSNNDNVEDDSSQEQEVPPPASIFATAWCFITTFFSSLIPQPPPVV